MMQILGTKNDANPAPRMMQILGAKNDANPWQLGMRWLYLLDKYGIDFNSSSQYWEI